MLLFQNELHKFSEVNSTMTTFSAYKACNLEEAVLLVNDEREFTQIDPRNIIVNSMYDKFIYLAGISPTAKNRSDTFQYENLPCNMSINHKKRILWFYNTV